MSKPRLPKHARKAPALDHPPIVTESDLEVIQQARDLREKLKLAYSTPCPCCGAKPTVARIAKQIGMREATLWRFIHGKQVTLMEENFRKISEWVERQEQGLVGGEISRGSAIL